jgi:hypothetical protein
LRIYVKEKHQKEVIGLKRKITLLEKVKPLESETDKYIDPAR